MTTALPATPPIIGANATLPPSSGASAAGLEGEAGGGERSPSGVNEGDGGAGSGAGDVGGEDAGGGSGEGGDTGGGGAGGAGGAGGEAGGGTDGGALVSATVTVGSATANPSTTTPESARASEMLAEMRAASTLLAAAATSSWDCVTAAKDPASAASCWTTIVTRAPRLVTGGSMAETVRAASWRRRTEEAAATMAAGSGSAPSLMKARISAVLRLTAARWPSRGISSTKVVPPSSLLATQLWSKALSVRAAVSTAQSCPWLMSDSRVIVTLSAW
mmetsp:Transcript_35950/g.86161  ORF Transcript_35950/g.86161 Transcript_35950/m.86161 type:complete len:275 (+) Transcript_35950:370-1194(+)